MAQESDATRTVAERVRAVITRVDAARGRSGGGAVTILGASKRQPIEAVRAAYAAGVRDFGENYAQELVEKSVALAELPVRWHFIGALQRNKIGLVLGRVQTLPIDRPALVESLDKAAARAGIASQDVLIEVNFGESSKAGISPGALPHLLDALRHAAHLRCVGLMAIPPRVTDSPEDSRPWFRALAELRAAHGRGRPWLALRELSMGMSDDFEVAIEEGATMVRVGTALFGPRA